MNPTNTNVAILDAKRRYYQKKSPCYRRQDSILTLASAEPHLESPTKVANEDLDFEIYKGKQLTSISRRYWQQVQIHEWASGDAQFLKELLWPLFYTDYNPTRTQRCVIARFGGFEDIKLLE